MGALALVMAAVLAACTDDKPVEVSAGRRTGGPATTVDASDPTTSTSASTSTSTSTSTSPPATTAPKPKPAATTTTRTVLTTTTTTVPATCAPAGAAGPYVFDLYFTDPDHGWAAMNAPLRWTEDGGATWNPACFPEGYSGSVSTLAFQGERGWAVVHAAGDTEASSLMGTTDGGRHWRVLPFPESASRIADLAFVDGDHGWAVGTRPATTGNPLTGSGGLVLRTEDGGTTWTFQQLPEDVTGGLRHVSFMDRRHGWATGQTAAGAPVALATADGGATWTARPLPAGVYNVSGVAFADEAHGWVVGLVANNAAPPDNQAAVILATADGGGTWTEQSRTPGITLWNVGLLDAGHAWAAGGGIGGTLLTTADGGTTWRQWSAGRKALQTAFFTDPMHGWAGTVQGSCLLSTADGGASWDLHPVDPPGCTGFQ